MRAKNSAKSLASNGAPLFAETRPSRARYRLYKRGRAPPEFRRLGRFDFALRSASTIRRSVLASGRQLDGFAGGLYWNASGLSQYFLFVRPLIEKLELIPDRACGAFAHRESFFGIVDRGGRDVFKAHRAPAFEHGECGVNRARHDGGIKARSHSKSCCVIDTSRR